MAMTQEAKDAMKQYMREWRKNNKEKIDKYNAQYWEKKAKEAEVKKDG